jgi:hypothetical protein
MPSPTLKPPLNGMSNDNLGWAQISRAPFGRPSTLCPKIH